MDGAAPGPARAGRAERRNRRTVYLLEAGSTTIPRNTVNSTPRAQLERDGLVVTVDISRGKTTQQVKDIIHTAFAAKGVHLRDGEWEFMQIERRNMLVPMAGNVNGARFLNAHSRHDKCAYIRRRQSLAPVVNSRRRGDRSDEQEPVPVQIDDDVVMEEDDPAAVAEPDDQAVEIEEDIFQQAEEDPSPVITRRSQELREMVEGWEGPHVAALSCSKAGKLRPWPLPLTPASAETISRTQERPIVAIVGLTTQAEQTGLATYTTTPGFFKRFEKVTGRRQALLVNVNASTSDGSDYMQRYNIGNNELPAMVVTMAENEPIVAKTAEDGTMDSSETEVSAAIDQFCDIWES